MTNINHEGLSTFYADNLEISKYLLNPKPLACCFCASLVMLSAARLVLIAFPAFYQRISRNTSLLFSVVFMAVTFVLDFLLNHIRCLLTHSKYYESADGKQIRIWNSNTDILCNIKQQQRTFGMLSDPVCINPVIPFISHGSNQNHNLCIEIVKESQTHSSI